jgi:hypothetical protein
LDGLFVFHHPNEVLYCIAGGKLLPCKQTGCIWHLVYLDCVPKIGADTCPSKNQRTLMPTRMSKTASIDLSPSVSLFGRLLAAIDRVLMANARIAVRNGDLPRLGL